LFVQIDPLDASSTSHAFSGERAACELSFAHPDDGISAEILGSRRTRGSVPRAREGIKTLPAPRPVLEAEDGLAGWHYRIPPCAAIVGRAPSAGGGQFWLVLAGDAAVDGGDPLPANSCIFVGPEDPAFAGTSGRVGVELLCLQFRRRARD
jgi:hypothetical protein